MDNCDVLVRAAYRSERSYSFCTIRRKALGIGFAGYASVVLYVCEHATTVVCVYKPTCRRKSSFAPANWIEVVLCRSNWANWSERDCSMTRVVLCRSNWANWSERDCSMTRDGSDDYRPDHRLQKVSQLHETVSSLPSVLGLPVSVTTYRNGYSCSLHCFPYCRYFVLRHGIENISLRSATTCLTKPRTQVLLKG